jgi:hypothetical protein
MPSGAKGRAFESRIAQTNRMRGLEKREVDPEARTKVVAAFYFLPTFFMGLKRASQYSWVTESIPLVDALALAGELLQRVAGDPAAPFPISLQAPVPTPPVPAPG